jgi:hypothetical protein
MKLIVTCRASSSLASKRFSDFNAAERTLNAQQFSRKENRHVCSNY